MQTYYISQSNSYTIRTDITSSSEFTMSLQNMYTLENTTMSLVSASYTPYESYISFTGSIESASVGAEYRAQLLNSGSLEPIWHGTFQVYSASIVIDKVNYQNQNQQYISHESTNRYIIMD